MGEKGWSTLIRSGTWDVRMGRDDNDSYGASHKNWIRFIRFIGLDRLLSLPNSDSASDADALKSSCCDKHNMVTIPAVVTATWSWIRCPCW